jgi:hypothetical protein
MYALAAAYRGDPLPPMSHDRSVIHPSNLARVAKEVLGLEVPTEEEGPNTSGSAVTGPQAGGVNPDSEEVSAAATPQDPSSTGPSVPADPPASSSEPPSPGDGPASQAAGPAAAAPPPPPLPTFPSECVFAAVHVPTSVINTLKAEAATFAEATGTEPVSLSANDIITGLYAVARAVLGDMPLPGTRLAGAKGSGELSGVLCS